MSLPTPLLIDPANYRMRFPCSAADFYAENPPPGGGSGITLDGSMTAVGFALTAGVLSISDLNSSNGLVALDGSGNLYLPADIYPASGAIFASPGNRFLYDQFSEQAISTMSDSINTDSTTTIIADPDDGAAAVNGTLFVRQTIQLQSFGGATNLQLNNDGSIADSTSSTGFTGQVLQNNGGPNTWQYPAYANENAMTDSGSNLFYPNEAVLADGSSYNLHYPDGSILGDAGGSLYVNRGVGEVLVSGGPGSPISAVVPGGDVSGTLDALAVNSFLGGLIIPESPTENIVGFWTPQGISTNGVYFGDGSPADTVSGSVALYFNVTGAPGTSLTPGTLIYQTSTGGTSWTAIL